MNKSILKTNRKPGISFVIRCRNEQDYLSESITSLAKLKVPYEIILILHLCTDNSEKIALQLQTEGHPIKLHKYDQQVSRAGYETLATPDSHPASLSNYYNYCMSKANFNWLCKWDADFAATPGLISEFNKLNLKQTKPTKTYINVRLGHTWHSEPYLFNDLYPYRKYIFWEVPRFPAKTTVAYFKKGHIKSISPKITKSYWHAKPWFLDKITYDKDLALKYTLITMLAGKEKIGLAKAMNPEIKKPYFIIKRNRKLLKKFGINFKF